MRHTFSYWMSFAKCSTVQLVAIVLDHTLLQLTVYVGCFTAFVWMRIDPSDDTVPQPKWRQRFEWTWQGASSMHLTTHDMFCGRDSQFYMALRIVSEVVVNLCAADLCSYVTFYLSSRSRLIFFVFHTSGFGGNLWTVWMQNLVPTFGRDVSWLRGSNKSWRIQIPILEWSDLWIEHLGISLESQIVNIRIQKYMIMPI